MASAAAAVELMCLPTEILEMIFPLALASKNGADLKRLRLMNQRLALFVEPRLFRWICLSTVGENFEAWKSIAQPGSRLRHYVEHVCIDCTTFIPHISRWFYCKYLAQHLKENPGKIHPRQHGKGARRGDDDSDAAIYTPMNLFSDLTSGERATTLLPGDRKLLQRGYKEYLLLAESQDQIRSSSRLYEALVRGLPSLPRVQAFSFMSKWHVDMKFARKQHEPEGIDIESEGSLNLPGPLARQHPPLRLPPQSTRTWSGIHGIPLLKEYFVVVLRAVRKLDLDLRTLNGPGPNQSCLVSKPHLESLDPVRDIGLPIETFAPAVQAKHSVELRKLVTGSSSALHKLRKLELSVSAPLQGGERYPHGTAYSATPGHLPGLLRSMPDTEELALRQHRYIGKDNGVANLNDVFGIRESVVHRSIITNSKTPPEFHYHFWGQDILGVWQVPFLPKLRHLELSGFEVRRGGLNSLLSRMASTLETVKLHDIRLTNTVFGWSFVLHDLRQVFCKRSPTLELSLGFPKSEYVALLLGYHVIPDKASEETSSDERMRSGFRRIERCITLEVERQTFREWLAPLRA
ncbi:hypothetical protein EPUS_04130 [Endocarpon pusillum Z07020]|uniref:Uncharacterized protein n=1 Tax=Endocarpon pusillum (strain Z07020 / HMAS-L-300199) TaxID=1263415 RepID=U1G7U4_ENDPU|nr:uncharacterized protein EPUS_04130 [Endocarpon pusillum Z07020]ERF73507.1 hypothetical protein EPUS_04130 [Endocarpon pusillum Z07020]